MFKTGQTLLLLD